MLNLRYSLTVEALRSNDANFDIFDLQSDVGCF